METIESLFSMITWWGLLWLLLLVVVLPVAFILINKWRNGESISFSFSSLDPRNIKLGSLKPKNIKETLKGNKPDDGSVLCLNVYANKIVGEYMLKKAVNEISDTWGLGNKKYLLQGRTKDTWSPVLLPSIISYPTERLARMMECPLTKLKSLKFHWYEHAAPFAPVVALGIGALLWVVVI